MIDKTATTDRSFTKSSFKILDYVTDFSGFPPAITILLKTIQETLGKTHAKITPSLYYSKLKLKPPYPSSKSDSLISVKVTLWDTLFVCSNPLYSFLSSVKYQFSAVTLHRYHGDPPLRLVVWYHGYTSHHSGLDCSYHSNISCEHIL